MRSKIKRATILALLSTILILQACSSPREIVVLGPDEKITPIEGKNSFEVPAPVLQELIERCLLLQAKLDNCGCNSGGRINDISLMIVGLIGQLDKMPLKDELRAKIKQYMEGALTAAQLYEYLKNGQ